MTKQRWQRVKELFHAANERPPEARAAFLAFEAGDDASLRREVESMLAMDADDASVLDGFAFRPAGLSVDALLSGVSVQPAARPVLSAGHRIGSYEIVELVGAGGMGEVYRARDAKLNREVALKVIPPSLAMNPDRLARLRREAQLLAALNHPNIAAIYGVEDAADVPALVLELIAGPTLAARIADGALPLTEALPIARQIAEGLEAAHEQGIIHRDLKPSNIHVRTDGVVKILDFGLAKSLAADGVMTPEEGAPAAREPGTTREGIILGTAGYMSPEQARGQAVDTRGDIWAFGCVLFEMLAGRPAFGGETVTDVLAAVVNAEPEWSALPADLPLGIRTLLRRCLNKDSRSRLQAIGDARIELAAITAAGERVGRANLPAGPLAKAGQVGAKERRAWLAAVVLLGAGVVGLAVTGAFTSPRPPLTSRTIVPLPEKVFYYRCGTPAYRLGISPDGSRLAIAASSPKRSTFQLWVRPLDSLTAVPLAGTEMGGGQFGPIWSPDSRFIAWVTTGNLMIKKIDASGGPPVTIGQVEAAKGAPGGAAAGGTRSKRDVILFGTNSQTVAGAIRRVSGAGGAVSVVISPDASKGETELWHPHFLPDDNHFLFLAVGPVDGMASKPLGFYASSLDGKERKLIMPVSSNAKYVNGYLLFLRESTLMAQRFDVDRLELSGEAVPIAEHVLIGGPTGATGAYAVSQSGVLAYIAGDPLGVASASQLTWLDRQGRAQGTLGDPAVYRDLELSSDAAHLVVNIEDETAPRANLWMFDVARGLRPKFTQGGGGSPAWTPANKRVYFSPSAAPNSIFVKAADGSGAEDRITREGPPVVPRSWSRDGRYLAGELGNDIAVMRFARGEPELSMVVQTPAEETSPRFSPDGRWMAYVSSETGRPEVYVSPFPGPGGRILVSTAGGTQPRWRSDGSEIFYITTSTTSSWPLPSTAKAPPSRLGPSRRSSTSRSGRSAQPIHLPIRRHA